MLAEMWVILEKCSANVIYVLKRIEDSFAENSIAMLTHEAAQTTRTHSTKNSLSEWM